MATKKKAVKAVAAVKVNPDLINAYEPKPTHISLESEHKRFGGWNPETKLFTPIKFAALRKQDPFPFSAETHVLNCITFAAEAGALDGKKFVEQVFAKRSDFDAFCDGLEVCDTYWMNDRHFYAVLDLAGDESLVLTYQLLGESLYETYTEGNV